MEKPDRVSGNGHFDGQNGLHILSVKVSIKKIKSAVHKDSKHVNEAYGSVPTYDCTTHNLFPGQCPTVRHPDRRYWLEESSSFCVMAVAAEVLSYHSAEFQH